MKVGSKGPIFDKNYLKKNKMPVRDFFSIARGHANLQNEIE